MLQVSLYRYNPESDEAPHMQEFSVDTGGKDLMVLDVLELIKADYDGSVTYRRSCREGVCGSDGLNINGKNGLACITPLSETVKGGKLVIRPLPGLPVIRDLVVDMSLFLRAVREGAALFAERLTRTCDRALAVTRRASAIRRAL